MEIWQLRSIYNIKVSSNLVFRNLNSEMFCSTLSIDKYVWNYVTSDFYLGDHRSFDKFDFSPIDT